MQKRYEESERFARWLEGQQVKLTPMQLALAQAYIQEGVTGYRRAGGKTFALQLVNRFREETGWPKKSSTAAR